jgi:hypothetical protein
MYHDPFERRSYTNTLPKNLYSRNPTRQRRRPQPPPSPGARDLSHPPRDGQRRGPQPELADPDGEADADADVEEESEGEEDAGGDVEEDADEDGDGDEEAEGDGDGDVEADGEGEGEADGDGDGDVEADGEGEGEADGDGDGDVEADGEAEADALGGTAGSTDGLRNADADGPRSVAGVTRAECREREGRPCAEPLGADGAELTISGAWYPDSGASAAPVSDWTRPAGDSGMAPVSTKTTAAQAATNPAVTHAGPRNRDRDHAGPRDRARARGHAAPRDRARAPDRDRDRRRPECRPPPAPAPPADTPATEATEATEATKAAPDPLASSSLSTPPADGRSPGSLARQLPIRNRREPGTSLRSAGLLTSRYISKALDPTPNGPCPVAA